ncbi:Hypothetical predicted protein [Podarcis lilfordi]|uniref:C-type lectin domain-containing protein n=1 Tax=Podarcis lilfordi TaxID=74358 RepID=A0AA35KYJ5_9SAUR|nr:Hypothetical predicted protein [Podarcis lilfordi]
MKDIIDRIAKVELRLSQLEKISAAFRKEITGLRRNNNVLMDKISKVEDGSKGGQVKGSGGPCPEDWFSFSRFCYKYNENPESWNRAEAKCQAYSPGVHLATIANREEMAAVAKELAKRVQRKHQVWIGMHRMKGGKTLLYGMIISVRKSFPFCADFHCTECSSLPWLSKQLP